MNILYEDGRLIAVSKPAGQLVIPGRGGVFTTTLREEIEGRVGGRIFVVHRLDRGASGVVLFAKDAETHRRLSLDFEGRRVEKVYRVLAEGRLQKDGRVESPLREFGSGRMGVAPGGKPSVTDFSVLERFRAATLLEVRPLTGRRHQIRVHLYSIGHPVMGDDRYGKVRPVGSVSRLMLHALRIVLPKEEWGERVFEAPLPEDFQAIVATLRDCG